MTNIAIIGGGKIGEALISGLLSQETVAPKDITVANRRSERSEELSNTYGVVCVTEASIAAEGADILFLCVKPKDVLGVLEQISPVLESSSLETIVVSMAAGLSTKTLEESLSLGTAVIRVMPNTPMLVGRGMSAFSRGRFVNDEQCEEISRLLSAVGAVLEVNEKDMDAVTALSGSAPAYFFMVIEAMTDAGIALGLQYDVARRLAVETMAGSAQLLLETHQPAAVLRTAVQSPGGTTIAAVEELEKAGLRSAFMQATRACARRSAELG